MYSTTMLSLEYFEAVEVPFLYFISLDQFDY
jgi:hypothetical protein